jgi:uncharacterized protein (DUF2235 family)
MSKRIAFCADGTWNTADSHTNVYRLYKAMLTQADQVAFYDDGVGADGNPIDRLLGGAVGEGLYKKIKDAYTKIAHTYEKDDELFIFGFSRGAFTARSLAGMIAGCGLPTAALDPNDNTFVETVFSAYRNPAHRQQILAPLAGKSLHDAKITMIGVWDTVGALGIPAIIGGIDPLRYGFLDTTLHPDVQNAYHALSIDERRREFPATLWTGNPANGQTIEQVWFSGVHCDVGGGYTETDLSDITLRWMMKKATAHGLVFDQTVFQALSQLDPKHATGKIHESWNLGWGIPNLRHVPNDATVGSSVYLRCQAGHYVPRSLQLVEGAPANGYTKVDVFA